MIEVHAARVGKCRRALAFHLLKYPKEKLKEGVMEIFEEGERLEEVVLDELRESGHKVKRGKTLSRIIRVGDHQVKLIGNPDCFLFHEGEWIPGEVKTMNKYRYTRMAKNFKKWEDQLKIPYGFQMLSYIILYGSTKIAMILKEKVGKGRNEGKFNMLIVPIEDLPSKESLKERIKFAIGGVYGEEILPENFASCRYCNYNISCGKRMGKGSRKASLQEEDWDFLSKLMKADEEINKLKEDLQILEDQRNKISKIASFKYDIKTLEAF